MTAEPSGPPPDFAALDRRLSAVEHRQEHELTQEIAATGEAVRLLHDGLRDVDRAVTRVGQRLDQVAAAQQDAARELARNGQKLDQVEAGVATVARSQIEHGAALAGKVDRLDLKADALASIGGQNASALAQQGGQVEALQRDVAGVMGLQEDQGRLLTEILRRLPAAPE
jgi:predicted phage tail protein